MHTFRREFIFFKKNPLQSIIPVLFFLLTTLLFPLSISPNAHFLREIGAGIIWVSILLALLLSQSQLIQRDYESGILDQLLIQSELLPYLFKKILTHWLIIIFPMILLTPMLSLMYGFPFFAIITLIVSLLLGTPILCILGLIMAALCVGIRNDGLLLAIILLPLYIPTLIFGTTVVSAAMLGLSIFFQLELLGAFLILALTVGVSVAAYALRMGITYS